MTEYAGLEASLNGILSNRNMMFKEAQAPMEATPGEQQAADPQQAQMAQQGAAAAAAQQPAQMMTPQDMVTQYLQQITEAINGLVQVLQLNPGMIPTQMPGQQPMGMQQPAAVPPQQPAVAPTPAPAQPPQQQPVV